MDVFIAKLFNNGDNDGDLKIETFDGKIIRCHSFVVEKMSEYFQTLADFREKTNNNSSLVKIAHDYYTVKAVIGKIYSANYEIPDDNDDDEVSVYKNIMNIMALIDELRLVQSKEIIFESLYPYLNVNAYSFVHILMKIRQFDGFEYIIDKIIREARYYVSLPDIKIPRELEPLFSRYTVKYNIENLGHGKKVYIINKLAKEYVQISRTALEKMEIDSLLYFIYRYKIWGSDVQNGNLEIAYQYGSQIYGYKKLDYVLAFYKTSFVPFDNWCD